MLKGIPAVLSPELLKVLCEMGHGDSIVIGDGNFPANSVGKDAVVLRFDGQSIPELLEAILEVMPLDTYVDKPVTLMEVVPGDDVETPIWDEYSGILKKYDARGEACIKHVERFEFYERAEKAYAILASGEKALYANIMLQKGVVV